MDNPQISIIIPAHNEAEVIGSIISQIKKLHSNAEVIVVDDGSTDNTSTIAENAGAIVHRHPYNIGNGAAVKSGIRIAKGDILVLMDADGQHAPDDIAEMLHYFPDFDMVVGARSISAQASFSRALGNIIYNWMASYVAKFKIKDLTSGFRAVKANIALNFLSFLPNSYSYTTTSTLCVLRSGNTIKYVDIKTHHRKTGKSNIKIFQDGLRFFMIIVKICTLYSPFRIFLPVSFALFLIGIFYYFYTFFTAGRFTNMSALLFTTSVIIFMLGLISEQICQMRYERREDKSSD